MTRYKMAGNTGQPGASVVDRALAVLRTFDEHHRRQTLAQVARRAGLPAPTALRLLRQLVDGGALTKDDADGHYGVGRLLWDLGHLTRVETDLRAVASPFLHDLHAVTRATVHLAVRERHRVLYVDRLAGRASVPIVSKVGSHLPLHATGVGKVLLAHAPDDVVEQVMRRLTRLTPHTIVAPALLARQLHQVRAQGFAITVEEMSMGTSSIAVPVHGPGPDGGDDVVAALGVVVRSLRREKNQLVTALRVAASGIDRALAVDPSHSY